MKNTKDNKFTNLSEAFLSFESAQEVKAFLQDLLSSSELSELEKRWIAAQKLAEGFSYSDIEKDTGLSSTTVARVSKALKSEVKGYLRAISLKDS